MSKVKCNECGLDDVVKAGRRWRKIANDPPKRVRVRQYRCKKCGKLFVPDDALGIDEKE